MDGGPTIPMNIACATYVNAAHPKIFYIGKKTFSTHEVNFTVHDRKEIRIRIGARSCCLIGSPR
jgi:hypothetical protein